MLNLYAASRFLRINYCRHFASTPKYSSFSIWRKSFGTKKEQKNVVPDDLLDCKGTTTEIRRGKGWENAQRGLPKEPEMRERGRRWQALGSLRRGCILRFTLGYLARPIGKGDGFFRDSLRNWKKRWLLGMTKQKLFIRCVSRRDYKLANSVDFVEDDRSMR